MTDNEFAEDLMGFMARQERDELRDRFRKLDEQDGLDLEKLVTKLNRKKWIWRFVGLFLGLLVIVLIYLFYIRKPATPPEDFEPFPAIALVTLSANQDEIFRLRTKAKQLYEEGSYKKANQVFEELIRMDEDPRLLFFGGISALASHQPDKAIQYLIRFEPESGLLFDDVRWYRALALREMGDIEAAQLLWQSLAEGGGDYKEKALELMEETAGKSN